MEDELTVRPSGIAARCVPVRCRQRTQQPVKLPPRFLQFVANALPDLAVAHVEPSAAFKSAGTTASPITRMGHLGKGRLAGSLADPNYGRLARFSAPHAAAALRATACAPTRCPSRSSASAPCP